MNPFSNKEGKTRVIVAGYPKSGNTWATRLVAEILQAPVGGFLGAEGYAEIAIEGGERRSPFIVYKSHHDGPSLQTMVAPGDRIIHILRDPRDVALSASRFFRCHRWPRFEAFFRSQPRVIRAFDTRLIYPILHTEAYRRKRSITAILEGDANVHRWVGLSWANHLRSFGGVDCLVLRYEDLLRDGLGEARRVVNYLGHSCSDQNIRVAIEKQSFNSKKKKFLESGDLRRAEFLKEGIAEQWRKRMTPGEIRLFSSQIGTWMGKSGYPLH